MERKTAASRIPIGITSIILIFIVLCLSVLALLSLNQAARGYASVKKNGEWVAAYYEADSQAQQWIHSQKQAGAPDALTADFPIAGDQSLHVELAPETLRILSYQVITNETLTIDDSLPVWQGEMEFKP